MTTIDEQLDALELAGLDEAILRRGPRSLAAFVARAWPIVEPETQLVWNWHLDTICGQLQRVPDEVQDLVVCIPPGLMKSLLVSVFWPAWVWLEHPGERVIAFSKNPKVAKRDSRRMRHIVQSPWYQRLVQEMHNRHGTAVWQLQRDQNETISFENSRAGTRQSLSLGGGVTGERCDGIIIDDPLDAKDVILGDPAQVAKRVEEVNDIIEKVLPTRLNDPKRSWRVIIMQRLHVNDPAQRAIDGGAVHVVLPMRYDPDHPEANEADNREPDELLFPLRYDNDFDEDMRGSHKLGEFHYRTQYGQRATAAMGGLFQREWFGLTYNFDAQRFKFDQVAITVDCSFKKNKTTDYVAIEVWGRLGSKRYLLDVAHARMSYPETRATFKRICQKWAHASFALIEDKANGSALIDDLENSYKGIPLIPYNPQASKYERAQIAALDWEAQLCYLPESAPFVHAFVEEHVAFGPGCTNDDLVDAGSQLLIRWRDEGTMDPDEILRRRLGFVQAM